MLSLYVFCGLKSVVVDKSKVVFIMTPNFLNITLYLFIVSLFPYSFFLTVKFRHDINECKSRVEKLRNTRTLQKLYTHLRILRNPTTKIIYLQLYSKDDKNIRKNY